MKRQHIIVILSISVSAFCITNVYQSSTIDQTSRADHFSFGRQMAPRMDGHYDQAIQIIAGGLNNSFVLKDDERASYLGADGRRYHVDYHADQHIIFRGTNDGSPNIIETIPGRRQYPNQMNLTESPDDLGRLPLPDGQCRLNSSHNHLRYKIVNGSRLHVPVWQQKLTACGRLGYRLNDTWRFFLAELLQVRLYTEDKARWTIRELKQWIHYVLLAGVQHIFLCDHYEKQTERLDLLLQAYIKNGLITYIPWSNYRNPMQAQIKCYQYIIDNYKKHTRWQMAIDMDEYPFTPQDNSEGFLANYLRDMTDKLGARISEISMKNFLMLGQGDRKRDIVIDRINRMTPKAANALVKPIYKPERVRANIHHNSIMFGTQLNADSDILRMLHYWGARGQDWGPDTNHTLSITSEMDDMRDKWAVRLRNSLLTFGEFDAFSNTSGP